MLKVASLKARSLSVDYIEVSWTIEDTTEDLFDYTFQVFRSESIAGPWDAITVPFQDRFFIRDVTAPAFHAARQLQYKLVVVNKMTGVSVEHGPVDMQPDTDKITAEIRSHFALLLREHTGRRCWLFPVRTFGQRCPSCFDQTLKKRTRSGCRSCYDTGYVRGYYAPIEVWVDVDANSVTSEQNMPTGPTHQQNNTASVGYFGPIKPRDILVEAENHRWRIVSVNQTEHVRAPVRMMLQLHLIPPSDIEYSLAIPLKENLKDLYLSPSRNFTNPQNLEATRDEEMAQAFQLYAGYKVTD